MSTAVRFDDVEVHLFEPAGSERLPSLIFLHERYGLVQHTLDLAAKAANHGYVGVAPDLFSRWTGDKEALRKGDVRAVLPDAAVARIIDTTIDHLKRYPRVDPERITLVGVCQSGRYAAVVSSGRRDLAACVVLYGSAQDSDWGASADQPRTMPDLVNHVGAPFLLIFGEADHVISMDNVRRLRGAFEDGRKSYRMRVFADMPHGWLNDTMPGRYRQIEAEEAWAMIVTFTREVFAGHWDSARTRWNFSSDVSVKYDFTRNVRLE
jgi:carboxymethylenebutenolidase